MMYVWPAARQPRKSVRLRAKSWPGTAPKVSQVRNHHRAAGPTRRSRIASSGGVQRVPGLQRAGVEDLAVDVGLAPFAVPPELQLGDRAIGLMLRDPGERVGPGARAVPGVQAAEQAPVELAAAPPRVRQAGPQARAGAGAVEEHQAERVAARHGGECNAYLPVPLICRECRESFVFTPERQREWYEVRGRYLGKSPLRCQTCGPRHGLQVRVGKALQAALRELDGRDVEALLRVAELHGELGHAAKAEEFVRRACNQAERRDCLPAIAARVSALRERLSAAAAER
jgi:hypothetical protein